jgi:hypothetical protein
MLPIAAISPVPVVVSEAMARRGRELGGRGSEGEGEGEGEGEAQGKGLRATVQCA